MVKPLGVGHAVLKVRDLDRSLDFYCRVLGFKEVRRSGSGVVLLRCSNQHHDLGLMPVGPQAETPGPNHVGLFHVALPVAGEQALREAHAELQHEGVKITGLVNHGFTHSIYLEDPDGNPLELYADQYAGTDWEIPQAPSLSPQNFPNRPLEL